MQASDVQIAIILALLSRLLGWHASIGGFLTSVLLVPGSAALMKRVAAIRKHLSTLTDARVKLCAEIVSGARLSSLPCIFQVSCPESRHTNKCMWPF